MEKRITITPAKVDALTAGCLLDPLTLGLSIEILPSGKKVWKYRRRLPGAGDFVKATLGVFPAHSIADARKWAAALNEKVEAGIDPREAARDADDRTKMTVERAHSLYMTAVREGRASRAKRKNKPRTIAEKLAIYKCDIAPKLVSEVTYDIEEADLTRLVIAKGKTSRCRANRLATELKVFFGWAAADEHCAAPASIGASGVLTSPARWERRCSNASSNRAGSSDIPTPAPCGSRRSAPKNFGIGSDMSN